MTDYAERESMQDQATIFASIIESSRDAILTRTPEGVITSMNAAAESLYGITAAEAVGQPTDVVAYSMFGPDGPPEIALTIRSAMARGTPIPSMEMTLPRPDGSDGIFTLTFDSIKDSAGTIIAYSLSLRDVTEARGAEERLRQAQRLESVGSLAGGIAHDFNNLLTIIQASSELLLAKLDDERSRMRAQQIIDAARLGATITGRLMAFSRQQVLQPEILDLNEVVGETCTLLEGVIGGNCLLRYELSVERLPTLIDRSQLQQVILNLCLNARDAMPSGGTITIRTKSASVDQADGGMRLDIPAGRYAKLEITDTGIGMDAETKRQIFDPFFTTKETGNGLGLATVYGIAEQSGATMILDSEPGLGTTFHIYFPAH